jgi:putative colanic acid biosynthesis acetyltransferase WcaF
MTRSFALAQVEVGTGNRVRRALWCIVSKLLYRPSPTPLHAWRRGLLKAFGARIGAGAHPYPRARIWAPWNLTMGEHSCIADDVDCYSVGPVTLGPHATVSQYSYLCSASHDYRVPSLPLVVAPIVIEADAWVAADVFVGPGVRIGRGAVIGARSAVFADVPDWAVMVGSPARQQGLRPAFERSVAGSPVVGSLASAPALHADS